MKSISNKMILIFFIVLLLSFDAYSQNVWFKRVLITNDNGIEDTKTLELAKAFSQIAETYVAVPAENKSGSSTYLGAVSKGIVKTERREMGSGIIAYAVDGYPAVCVAIACLAIMKDNLPDLVISGINGGPNLGTDWLGSGTIGAARIAAFAGVPAIAVSGLDSRIPGSLEFAINWIVNFVKSDVVKNLKAPNYLTIGIPRISPDKIQGVRIAERSTLVDYPEFEKVTTGDNDNKKEAWKIVGRIKLKTSPPDSSDVVLYKKDFIIVTPMIANEIDHQLLDSLKKDLYKID